MKPISEIENAWIRRPLGVLIFIMWLIFLPLGFLLQFGQDIGLAFLDTCVDAYETTRDLFNDIRRKW